MTDETKAIDLSGDEGYDEDDETLSERVWALTEMFPDSLRNAAYYMSKNSLSGVKSLYSLSRSLVWVVFTTTSILVAPLALEMERSQMEEYSRQQQRQILLGPNAAMSGPQGMSSHPEWSNIQSPMPPQRSL